MGESEREHERKQTNHPAVTEAVSAQQRESLLARIEREVLIADGAMATQLYQMGTPVGICYEALCLERPNAVTAVHKSYLEAGASLLETNTFGANAHGLARYGLEGKVVEINRAAVRLARQVAGEQAYVAGTVGSVRGVRPAGPVRAELEAIYREQIEALLTEAPDALLFETFYDLDELEIALDVARSLTVLPAIAQLSLIDLGVTRDGVALSDAFARLYDHGASIVGLNCRFGPSDMLRVLEKANLRATDRISVFPNAGLLSVTDGAYHYASEPEYFGEIAQSFHAMGVRIIGGCCGTTPDHIRAMANAVAGRAPAPVKAGGNAAREGTDARRPRVAERSVLHSDDARAGELVHEKARHTHTVIVELDPPKDLSPNVFLEGARALHAAGADAVTLADNSLAVTRMSNMALGAMMKQMGVEPLLHMSCRDRNLIGQQSHLMGLHALGIRQVLAITGDPSRFGDFPGATSVFDVSSFDLIRMIKQLNDGRSFTGRALDECARFTVGAAFNPHVRHLDKAIRRLERKVEAGADFIMTQPIYDPEFFDVLADLTSHVNVPIFVGIMPLLSARNAEFLHNEVPGITLTDDVRKRMAEAGTGAHARSVGVEIARELVDAAMKRFRGIYLITPMMRYEMTVGLVEHVARTARNMDQAGSTPA